MEKGKDQVIDDIINPKKDDQADNKQSEEPKKEEPLTLEKMGELVKGLQKGYTLTRQDVSEMKDNLAAIAEMANRQTGAVSGEDQFLTVGKLRELLQQQYSFQENAKTQADTYIDETLAQLRAEGQIASDEEEESLLNFALKIHEPNLTKAAIAFGEIKQAKEEGKKEAAKTKVKQEEGSKIGTSSKTSTGEQGGVDYSKVRKMDWHQF
jgi:hypothetical protein